MSVNLVVILIIALAHTFIHYSIFSGGNDSRGISGFSVTEVDASNSQTFSLSLLIIGFEWATLISVLVFSVTRERVNNSPKFKLNLDRDKLKKIAKSGTEIDLLYEVIKNNHSLKLSVIQKLFDVNKDEVLSWGKTLTDANLIYINYPSIGEPELVIK